MRILAAAAVVVSAVLVGLLGYPSLASSLRAATSPVVAEPGGHRSQDSSRRDGRAPRGEAEDVPHGTTVFDADTAAVRKLDPDLRRALRRAATAAAADGVTLHVNSGWRSRAHQQQLFDEAVSKYGSEAAAARWVAPPGTSAHETGDAVDLGHADATAWLVDHGAQYGLCPIYRNEPWHYERRADAVGRGCPPMYADSTRDPRLRR